MTTLVKKLFHGIVAVALAVAAIAGSLAFGVTAASAKPKDPRTSGTCYFGARSYTEGSIINLGPLGKLYCGADGNWHKLDW